MVNGGCLHQVFIYSVHLRDIHKTASKALSFELNVLNRGPYGQGEWVLVVVSTFLCRQEEIFPLHCAKLLGIERSEAGGLGACPHEKHEGSYAA